MIPINYLGSHFLNPARNTDQPIITARLPIPQKITYEDTVDTGGPVRTLFVSKGLAEVVLRDAFSIPRKFQVDLYINGVHDIALVDRVE